MKKYILPILIGAFVVTILAQCVINIADARTGICPPGEGLVIRVVDGDTIGMEDGKMIRILGIDTFDTNHRMAKKQRKRTGFSAEKVKYMSYLGTLKAKELLFGKCVRLIKARTDKGKYGRYLRFVEIEGEDFQKIMLQTCITGKGKRDCLANVYCHFRADNPRFEEYLEVSEFKCKK